MLKHVSQPQHRIHSVLLALILLAYLFLGINYALATPPLESSDEYKHFPVVAYIQQTGKFPILDPDAPGKWLQEGAQPPLYYFLAAQLIRGVDLSDFEQIHQPNKHAFIGNPNQIKNKNIVLHESDDIVWLGEGTVRAINIIRLASIALGAVTVMMTYKLGRDLFSIPIALFAAALVAFNPMFLFTSAAVNNDALANAIGATALWLLVRLYRRPSGTVGAKNLSPLRSILPYIVLGNLLGAGMLTKLSLGGLLALSGLALAVRAIRDRDFRTFLWHGTLVLLPALGLAAPMLWRNWQLYGDLTALNTFVAVQGTRAQAITAADWLAEFGTFYRSFWGLFGGVNIAAPAPFYVFMNAVAVVALLGLGLRLRRKATAGTWLLVAWSAILFILLVRWNIISPAFQGRLLFPALSALMVLMALGLSEAILFLKKIPLNKAQLGFSAAFFLAAAILPWQTIRPEYVQPATTSLPAAAAFGPMTFHAPDGDIQLVGVELVPQQAVQAGGAQPVRVALYWKSESAVAGDYVSTVHLLGRDHLSIGATARHPAWGMIPTSRWQRGQIYRDEYHIYANADAVAPTRLRLAVNLYDTQTEANLPVTDATGASPDFIIVGEAVLRAPQAEKQPMAALNLPFEGGVTLLGYQLDTRNDDSAVTFFWQADAPLPQNMTVFVHLLDADGNQIASADSPPIHDYYPTTLWQRGDLIDDRHPITAPAGTYSVRVGLYDPLSGARLQLMEGGDSAEITLVLP